MRFKHHHAEHHFLNLYPLGPGFEIPPDGNELNNTGVDEQFGGYTPHNKLWESFSKAVERIEGRGGGG